MQHKPTWLDNPTAPPTNLHSLQAEQKYWAEYNFPMSINPELPWVPVMGVAEESGELSHAMLKMYQGIRGTREEHLNAIRDAVGDITIYLVDLCNQLGMDFEQTVLNTWADVRKRDWQANPNTGVAFAQEGTAALPLETVIKPEHEILKCAVVYCNEDVPAKYYLCQNHWYQILAADRLAAANAFTPGQSRLNPSSMSSVYMRIMTKNIEALNTREF